MSATTRRQFLKSSAVAGAVLSAPWVITSPVRGQEAPSNRINLGFIGVGTMGRGHLGRFLGYGDVQVRAVCDVVRQRRDDARDMVHRKYSDSAKGTWSGCTAHTDFREVLTNTEIDAVVIATPDHWHAIPAILAARAKKDIYCEKPLTHNIVEGRKLVQAVSENGIIFQTGSQQRSEFGGKFRQAVELIQNGRIGDVMTVTVGVGAPPVPCDLPEEELPKGIHWDFWLGPAPERAFNQVLCPIGIHKHFPQWRAYQEYAGGGLADMGAHHFDIAQWALGMDNSGPVRIEPPADGRNSGLRLTYANGVTMYHGGPSGCTFVGTRGMLYVDRSHMSSEPAKIIEEPLPDDAKRVYFSDQHHRNWLDCIRSREQPICPAETGHRSASVCHLANIGYRLSRPLTWNPEMERFEGDAEANGLLWREPRKEWNLI